MADNTMNEYPKKGLSQAERAEAEQNQVDGGNEGKKFEPETPDKPDGMAKMDTDITEEDMEILGDKDQDMDGGDDELMKNTGLDDTDADGTPLNEESGDTGNDLDVPGSELDNRAENIGGEDEENNLYSQSDNKD